MRNIYLDTVIIFIIIWSVIAIPLTAFLSIQICYKSDIIINQKILLDARTTTITTLLEERILVVKYKNLLETYYNSVLKAYGYNGIKVESIKVNPNNYKLKFPILPIGP